MTRYQSSREILRDLDRQRAAIAWKRTVWRRAPMAAGALLVVAALVAVSVTWWRSRPTPGPAGPVAERTSLAVLPFVNATNDPNFDWVRTGLPDTLAYELQQARALRLVGSDRVQELLLSLNVDDAPLLRADDSRRVMALLHADNTLRGTLYRAVDTFRLQATLLAAGGGEGHAIRVEGSGPTAIFTLADQLTGKVREVLGLVAERGESRRGASEITTASVEALRFYTEGLALARSGSDQESVRRLGIGGARDVVHGAGGGRLCLVSLSQAMPRLGQPRPGQRELRVGGHGKGCRSAGRSGAPSSPSADAVSRH